MPNARASRAVLRVRYAVGGASVRPQASKHGTGTDLRMGMGKSVTVAANFAITLSVWICAYWARAMTASVVVADGERKRAQVHGRNLGFSFAKEINGLCGADGRVDEKLPGIDGCWTRAR